MKTEGQAEVLDCGHARERDVPDCTICGFTACSVECAVNHDDDHNVPLLLMQARARQVQPEPGIAWGCLSRYEPEPDADPV